MTKLIHQHGHYCACVLPDNSLTVQNIHTGKGKLLKPEQSQEWIDAIETAIDKNEANAICKVIYNS